jgi:predicted transcriptional regulator
MRVYLSNNCIKIINAITQLTLLKEDININKIANVTCLSWHTVRNYLNNDLKIKGIY